VFNDKNRNNSAWLKP